MRLRLLAVLRHTVIGLVVMVGVTVPWSLVVVANVRLTPGALWAVPLGLIYVGVVVAYLTGRGWPASTVEARRRDFRARLLSPAETVWSLLAGTLAITCLWLLFAASGHLERQAVPGREALLPTGTLVALIIIGSAVTAIGEEGGLRGFMQAPLERRVGPRMAIIMSAATFVVIHATGGLLALTRNGPFYLGAGLVYGVLAYLTQSILPSLVLHFLGDILTFALRVSLVHLPGPHAGVPLTLCLVGAVVLAGLSIIAFGRLARVRASARLATDTSRTAREIGDRPAAEPGRSL
jgi:membrane protease YdiL (CAAX protease family)